VPTVRKRKTRNLRQIVTDKAAQMFHEGKRGYDLNSELGFFPWEIPLEYVEDELGS
jgi:hypothetical protein